MTTPTPASTSDIQARFYRPLTSRELDIGQDWLDDAWQMLLDRRPSLPADITAGTVSQRTVIRVLCGMVSRIFSNPQGLLEEQIDDYRYRRDSLVSSGALTVTPAEFADITPGRKAQRSVRLVANGEATSL